jgi:hypothetical protein
MQSIAKPKDILKLVDFETDDASVEPAPPSETAKRATVQPGDCETAAVFTLNVPTSSVHNKGQGAPATITQHTGKGDPGWAAIIENARAALDVEERRLGRRDSATALPPNNKNGRVEESAVSSVVRLSLIGDAGEPQGIAAVRRLAQLAYNFVPAPLQTLRAKAMPYAIAGVTFVVVVGGALALFAAFSGDTELTGIENADADPRASAMPPSETSVSKRGGVQTAPIIWSQPPARGREAWVETVETFKQLVGTAK